MRQTVTEPLAFADRQEDAPAKINLALHVTGRRPDGYHLVDSLVCFADVCDVLGCAVSAREDRLAVHGPFAGELPADGGNILFRALAAARKVLAREGLTLPPLALSLDKRLPVSAGVGGGSADAAALLRVISGSAPGMAAALRRASVAIGADVPMCMEGRACRASGIGEMMDPLPAFPRLAMVLVNPATRVATAEVFAALTSRLNPPLPPIPAAGFVRAEELLAYLGETRNDLDAPARGIAPPIESAREALAASGALFVRMSGSGATVYGLYRDRRSAEAAAASIRRQRPHWWVTAAMAGARHGAL